MAGMTGKAFDGVRTAFNWLRDHKKTVLAVTVATGASTALEGVGQQVKAGIEDAVIGEGANIAQDAFKKTPLGRLWDRIETRAEGMFAGFEKMIEAMWTRLVEGIWPSDDAASGSKEDAAGGKKDKPEVVQNHVPRVAEEIATEEKFKESQPGFFRKAWHDIWNKVSDKRKEWWDAAVGNPHEVKRDTQKIDAMMAFFKQKGWTTEQASGIVANLACESNLDHRAVGDKSKKTGEYLACGLAQWHPDRQAEFNRKFGHDMRSSTFNEQLEFVHYELTEGAEQRAGNKLRQTVSAREAGAIVSKHYERPADKQGEAAKRGEMAMLVGAHHNASLEVRLARNYGELRGEGLDVSGQTSGVSAKPAPVPVGASSHGKSSRKKPAGQFEPVGAASGPDLVG